jgi:hypothetical protein
MKKRMFFPVIILLLAILLFSACSDNEQDETPSPSPSPSVETTPRPTPVATPTPSPSETPDPEPVALNPLTGLPINEAYLNRRPVAIMINNIKQSLPQYGLSKADILYEVVAEGGITRLVAVMQDPSVAEVIGSVRSTRSYYLDIAQGHDALLLHAGASEMAYADIKTRGVTALDAIKGGYEGSLYYRDESRRKNNGFEHSLMTTGERIVKAVEKGSFRKEHGQDYTYPVKFEKNVELDGDPAAKVSVKMSAYKTGVFEYDPESRSYSVSQFGKAHIDAETGEQLKINNLLILFTKISAIKGDAYGRMEVDLVGSGDGLYTVNGRITKIRWSKASYTSPFVYTNPDGTELVLNTGTSYICIVSSASAVTVE